MTEFYGLEPGGLLPASALSQINTARMEVVAAGRPDIPATTPYSAAELAAMPIGTQYRSTNRPQGAQRWVRTGSSVWTCAEGFTGLRSVALDVDAAAYVEVGRAGDLVEVIANQAAVAGSATTAHILPSGFRSLRNTPFPYGESSTGALSKMGRVRSGGQLDFFGRAAGSGLYFRAAYFTSDPWPTTLPGGGGVADQRLALALLGLAVLIRQGVAA